MVKKITISLTKAEATAVYKGLESALMFWDTYFMFARYDTLNEGNQELDELRRGLAYKVMSMIDDKIDAPSIPSGRED